MLWPLAQHTEVGCPSQSVMSVAVCLHYLPIVMPGWLWRPKVGPTTREMRSRCA